MFLIRWRKRLLACALLCLVALVLLVSTQHRLRLAAIKIIPVPAANELNAPPDQLKDFRFYSTRAHGGSFSDAMRIFDRYTVAYFPAEAYALPTSEEPPVCIQAVRAHQPVHCYNEDIAYAQFFGANGYITRMWDLNGSEGLGGYGHNMLELWDDASHKWKAVDPYYHCYYAKGGSALSVLELRHALLTNDTGLRVVSFVDHARIYDSAMHAFRAPIYRAPKELLAELRMLVPTAMVHINNDFVARFAHRYGVMQFLAPLFDQLPIKERRGIRSAMMGSEDARLMIVDQYTPTYAATAVYGASRTLAALVVLFALLGLVGTLRSRRARVAVVRQPEQPPVLA